MSNDNAIEVVAKWGGLKDGQAWAKLEYYMEKNELQKEWRKVPGFVLGSTQEEVMSKAEKIAGDLSDLDIQELKPAVRLLFESNQMVRLL